MNSSNKRTLDEEDDTSLSKRLCTEERQLNKSDEVSENSLPEDVTPSARASENHVGITEYVSDLPGFSAVLKERYSDFLVNEIDTQGHIIRLSDMSKPKLSGLDCKADDLLDKKTMKKLQHLVSKYISEVAIDVTDADKDKRKDIHVAIRNMALNLESCTENRNSKKYIVVKNKESEKGKQSQSSIGENYLHFVLCKENKDTVDVIDTISRFLRVQPKVFSHAGSKDHNGGTTSQLVSVYGMNPVQLLSINQKYKRIKVGNIVYRKEQLRLGDIWGNKFVIILRQMKGEPDIVEQSMKSLSEKGFINYYGMHRFGTSSITHAIGRAVLREDWRRAVTLILTPRSEDDSKLVKAKKIWLSTKDAQKAHYILRKKWSIEAQLLSGLATAHKKDFLTPFTAVPRNMRLLYIHSYQSFIWNKVASKRIQAHGLKVLKGDLVPREPGDNSEHGDVGDKWKDKLSRKVTVLSEEDVDKYSISDVLLPLPGHSVVFPNNETKEYYDDFLKGDGMEWSNFDSDSKLYSLSGAYRKLIVIPEDLTWEIIPYSDVNIPLALSDLDKINKLSFGQNDSGPLTALKLEFKLPTSAYATMAVREILR